MYTRSSQLIAYLLGGGKKGLGMLSFNQPDIYIKMKQIQFICHLFLNHPAAEYKN